MRRMQACAQGMLAWAVGERCVSAERITRGDVAAWTTDSIRTGRLRSAIHSEMPAAVRSLVQVEMECSDGMIEWNASLEYSDGMLRWNA